jgi:aspartate racemase
VDGFRSAIDALKGEGAECVILGCTEIPLIINEENSSLPTLDSTRLLARDAVRLAMSGDVIPGKGWIKK